MLLRELIFSKFNRFIRPPSTFLRLSFMHILAVA